MSGYFGSEVRVNQIGDEMFVRQLAEIIVFAAAIFYASNDETKVVENQQTKWT